jgi:adenylate cyclase class IV
MLAKIIFSLLIVFISFGQSWAATEVELDPSNPKFERIENQYKFSLPISQLDEVYAKLKSTFINNKPELEKLSPDVTSSSNVSDFKDIYYDTPELTLLDTRGLIRHRIRFNLTNPSDRHSGRELIQVKVSYVNNKITARDEIKFNANESNKDKSIDDSAPYLVKIVAPAQRERFMKILNEMHVSPSNVFPVFELKDHRSRVAFQFQSDPKRDIAGISVDRFTVNVWWATVEVSQLEVEINEAAYTAADETKRQLLNAIVNKIIKKIQQIVPDAKLDVVPKYNAGFNAIEQKIPFMRFLVKYNLQSEDVMWKVLSALLIAICVLIYFIFSFFTRKPVKKGGLSNFS